MTLGRGTGRGVGHVTGTGLTSDIGIEGDHHGIDIGIGGGTSGVGGVTGIGITHKRGEDMDTAHHTTGGESLLTQDPGQGQGTYS